MTIYNLFQSAFLEHNPLRGRGGRQEARRGSALLVTLLSVSLLLVVVLMLVTVVRMELRTVTAQQSTLLARANARLGLELAVALLQETAGPDQRVTASGELLGPYPLTDPRSRWTGVRKSDGTVDTTWLLSGLEQGNLGVSRVEVHAEVPGVHPALEAGVVAIRNTAGGDPVGRYAFFVEDEGLKAALRVEAPDPESFVEGSLSPGAFTAHERLSGWETFTQGSLVPRLNSLRDVELLTSAPAQLAGRNRFDYTLHSLGVLSNARDGGLRKDLSTAFADPAAYDLVFDGGRDIVIDPDRLADAPELRPDRNNYIHWNIFRDYAQLYRRPEVQNLGRMTAASMSIDISFNPGNTNQRFANTGQYHNHGSLRHGPHGFPRYEGGDLRTHFVYVDDGNLMANEVRTDNPLKPILSHLYMRAWVNLEQSSTSNPSDPDAAPTVTLRGSAFMQPFFGIYNPYNVTLRTAELDMDFDMNVMFRITDQNGQVVTTSDNPLVFRNGWRAIWRSFAGAGHEAVTRFWSSKPNFEIGPGEVLLLMIPGGRVVDLSAVSRFEFELTDEYRAIAASGYEQPFEISGGPYQGPFTVEFQTFTDNSRSRPYFQLNRGSLAFQPARRPNNQPYQWFVSPFGYDSVRTWNNSVDFPGKRVVVENVVPGNDNYNNSAHFGMWMRTTREEDQGIRPLIDANLRAAFINPRWDVSASGAAGGLGLRTPAAYTGLPRDLSASGANQTVPGLGFNLWGIFDGRLNNPSGGLNFPQFRNQGGQMKGWWGEDHLSLGQPRIPLFDIPRAPLVSLGQLQHAEAGHYSYEPSYIVGNSYANPRIPLNDWRHSDARDRFLAGVMTDPFKISGTFNLYDASYLVNEVLWDGYTFTTLAEHFGEDPERYEDLVSGRTGLRNRRHRPHVPAGFAFDDSTLADAGEAGIRRNAAFVMADGAFNVNSTSVRAWEAFLSSTAGLPVARLNASGAVDGVWTPEDVRFPRLSSHTAGEDDFWEGFATLDPVQVRALAAAIVDQVRRRGPFLTLGDFVNRSLGGPTDAERRSGALQAALDSSVNATAFVDDHSDGVNLSFPATPPGAAQATGFPGHMLQGDILQALGPYLTTRSDTFTIRAYGETGTGGNATGIWAEAVVQRLPDPVRDSGAPPSVSTQRDSQLQSGHPRFGRRFEIVSFHWSAP